MRCMFFLLLLYGILAESRRLERVKRLSSPERNETTAELAKYVVSIRSRHHQLKFGDNHFCGGAIVAPKFVLTAATCVMNQFLINHPARSMVVVGGTPNRVIHTEDTIILKIQRIFVPGNFAKQNTNNIALIKLKSSWPTDNTNIEIINLPDEEPTIGTSCLVLGWGRLFKDGPLAGGLVHISVELLNRSTCDDMLNDIQPEMLCAGNMQTELDENPCGGDLGAPMICNNILIGIVSYRLSCSSKNVPSLYTDIWYHRDWINDILENCASPVTISFYTGICVLIALSA